MTFRLSPFAFLLLPSAFSSLHFDAQQADIIVLKRAFRESFYFVDHGVADSNGAMDVSFEDFSKTFHAEGFSVRILSVWNAIGVKHADVAVLHLDGFFGVIAAYRDAQREPQLIGGKLHYGNLAALLPS